MTVVSGLSFSLFTTLLIPIDVFFVSYAKLPNGTFAEWAQNSTLLKDVEDTLEDTYFGKIHKAIQLVVVVMNSSQKSLIVAEAAP